MESKVIMETNKQSVKLENTYFNPINRIKFSITNHVKRHKISNLLTNKFNMLSVGFVQDGWLLKQLAWHTKRIFKEDFNKLQSYIFFAGIGNLSKFCIKLGNLRKRTMYVQSAHSVSKFPLYQLLSYDFLPRKTCWQVLLSYQCKAALEVKSQFHKSSSLRKFSPHDS